ncbi:unnamed protein product [Dibothriocephalus latus]|uniref:Uncharacterized protein n=1 Tax=Dibothriocephalus latus TaxID=60516 RepID=A0A3P6THX4_DIBLA|nr:unnamed protein product [Dibothriocephalus latus]
MLYDSIPDLLSFLHGIFSDAPTAVIHNPHVHRSQRDELQLRQRVLMEAVTIVSGWMYEEPCFIDPSVYGEGNARHIDEVRQRLRAFKAGISSSVMEQLAAAARRVEERIAPPVLPATTTAAVDTVRVPSRGEPSTPSTLAVATLTSSGRQPRPHSTLNLPASGSARVCTPQGSIYAGGPTSKPNTKNYTPHGSNHGHADRTLSNGGHFDIASISKASCKLSAPSVHTHLLSPALSVRRTVVYFTAEQARHISPSLHHLTEGFSSGPEGPWLPAHVGSNEVEDRGPIVRTHQREQTVRELEDFYGGNGDYHPHSHHCHHRHRVPAQFCESEQRNRVLHHDKGYNARAPDVDLDNSLLNYQGALVRPPGALPPTPRDRQSPEAVSTISTIRHPIWDTPDVLKTSTRYLSLDL